MTALIIIAVIAVIGILIVCSCCRMAAENDPCKGCENESCGDCEYWKEMTGDG